MEEKVLLEDAYQERRFQTESQIESYMVEAQFFKGQASEKASLLEKYKFSNKETSQDKEALLEQCKD